MPRGIGDGALGAATAVPAKSAGARGPAVGIPFVLYPTPPLLLGPKTTLGPTVLLGPGKIF
jgi:hypothetical protein